MKKEPVERYSEALKQQVVREYESGVSIPQAPSTVGGTYHGR